jgi:hypothetical protein
VKGRLPDQAAGECGGRSTEVQKLDRSKPTTAHLDLKAHPPRLKRPVSLIQIHQAYRQAA